LDMASTMVAEQLLEDPFVKEDVTDIMQGENWHNLCLLGDENQVVGVATVEFSPDEPQAFLAYFVVDEAHRGRDLGRLLLGEVERFVSAAGATSLALEAFPDPRITDETQRRDPSTFFEHHGYEAFDPEDPVRRRKSL
jgi:GNAT superfamily N-acetyltransferase